MGPGESESAAAVLALSDPAEMLRRLFGDHFPDLGIAGVMTVGPGRDRPRRKIGAPMWTNGSGTNSVMPPVRRWMARSTS